MSETYDGISFTADEDDDSDDEDDPVQYTHTGELVVQTEDDETVVPVEDVELKHTTDIDADDFRRSEDDEEDFETVPHECPDCGYQTELDTPQTRAEAFCQGDCEQLTTLVRRDKLEDGQ